MFMVVFRGLFQFKVMLYSLNVRCRRVSMSLCVFFCFWGLHQYPFWPVLFLVGWLGVHIHTLIQRYVCVNSLDVVVSHLFFAPSIVW